MLILVGGLLSQAAAHLETSQFPSLWWLLPGLMVLVFAEVVRRGCLPRPSWMT